MSCINLLPQTLKLETLNPKCMQQWVRGDLQAPGIAAADVAGGNDQKPLLSTGGDQMEPRAGLGFGVSGFRKASGYMVGTSSSFAKFSRLTSELSKHLWKANPQLGTTPKTS